MGSFVPLGSHSASCRLQLRLPGALGGRAEGGVLENRAVTSDILGAQYTLDKGGTDVRNTCIDHAYRQARDCHPRSHSTKRLAIRNAFYFSYYDAWRIRWSSVESECAFSVDVAFDEELYTEDDFVEAPTLGEAIWRMLRDDRSEAPDVINAVHRCLENRVSSWLDFNRFDCPGPGKEGRDEMEKRERERE